jgi:hypothetical protein
MNLFFLQPKTPGQRGTAVASGGECGGFPGTWAACIAGHCGPSGRRFAWRGSACSGAGSGGAKAKPPAHCTAQGYQAEEASYRESIRVDRARLAAEQEAVEEDSFRADAERSRSAAAVATVNAEAVALEVRAAVQIAAKGVKNATHA